MRLALYQPDIPQNTGTILRMAACLGLAVDIIRPAGFDLSDKALKRSLMDYAGHVAVTRHDSWQAFLTAHRNRADARLIALTTKAGTRYVDFAFSPADTLLLGRETAGLPDDVRALSDAQVKIPLAGATRSLNVAIAAAMVAGEALRQTNGFPAA